MEGGGNFRLCRAGDLRQLFVRHCWRSLLLVTGLIHGLRLRRRATGPMEWAQAAASFAVPALLILLVLAGSTLTRLPRDQLFWGSTSFQGSVG